MKSIEDWQFGETIGKGSDSAIKIIRKITSKNLDVHLMVRPVQHHIDD